MPNIGFDARFFGSSSRGLGRYTSMLLKYLERLDQSNNYFVFLTQDQFAKYQPQNPRFKKIVADIPWYSLAEQVKFPRLLAQYQLDLIHFPHFNVPLLCPHPFLVTVHDLILLEYPTKRATKLHPFVYFLKELGYKKVLSKALRSSQKIITVSEFTKKDIQKNFPSLPPGKLKVIYEACEKPSSGLKLKEKDGSPQSVLFKLGLKSPYLFYAGAAYPHKNLENLLLGFKAAQEKLRQTQEYGDLSLALAGGDDYFYQRLKRFARTHQLKKVHFLNLVSERELAVLYQSAEAFIFPSLYEGFGLPPLEALAQKVPVISSNAACLPEILKSAAYYFNPLETDAIGKAIVKVLKDKELQQKLRKKGLRRIKKFSWEKTAQETLEAYQEIISPR